MVKKNRAAEAALRSLSPGGQADSINEPHHQKHNDPEWHRERDAPAETACGCELVILRRHCTPALSLARRVGAG